MSRKLTKQRIRSRVWLRSRATSQFFTRTGHWVDHRDAAFDFTDVQVALAYATGSGIADLEVILETTKGDFPVPVPGANVGIQASL